MGLLRSLSHFETDLQEEEFKISADAKAGSILRVMLNLLQRGRPTRATTFVEDYLQTTWGNIHVRPDGPGAITYCDTNVEKDWTKMLWAALFIVDPRVGKSALELPYWKAGLGSDLELRFGNYFLRLRGSEAWLQLLEPQCSLESILWYAYRSGECVKELWNIPLDTFAQQRVDMTIQLPAIFQSQKKGMIIEVDGAPFHSTMSSRLLDGQRDSAVKALKDTRWSVLRARSDAWNDLRQLVSRHDEEFFSDPYFKKVEENYTKPLYAQADGVRALSLALTPGSGAHSACRTGATLTREASFNGGAWRIGVIERDVDCAHVALNDLRQTMVSLCELAGLEWQRPELELEVFASREFHSSETDGHSKKPLDEAQSFDGDVLIDVSTLQRWGLSEAPRSAALATVTIRSSHSKSAIRQFASAAPLTYEPLMDGDAEERIPDPQTPDDH
ncbi:MAG: hypothetical protein IPI07_07470 [Flavobacteriales bacterium]|nr:hypothetical protein [Flavobacteriales bacterium]